MKTIIATMLGLGLALSSTFAFADVSAHQAKGHVSQRLQYSSKVADKAKPFKFELGGKKGDKLRSFTASNIRERLISFGTPASPGGVRTVRLHVGNRVTGTLNMKTGAVRVVSVISPR